MYKKLSCYHMCKNKVALIVRASLFVIIFCMAAPSASAVDPGGTCSVNVSTKSYTGTCRSTASGCESGEYNPGIGDCTVTGGVAYVCCIPKTQTESTSCTALNGTCTTASCANVVENATSGCVFGGTTNEVCCANDSSTASTSSASSSSGYTLLEKVPGTSGLGSDLPGYLVALYKVALVLVVLSAVLMVSIGGFMYLTSAGNTSSIGTAKAVITDALVGLVIALVAWLILNVINPDLTTVTIDTLSVNVSTSTSSAASSSTADTSSASSTTSTGSGSCGGYSVNGISSSQCTDASSALSTLLACMYAKYPNTKITSISDSAGFSTCKNSYSSACAHAKTSCHYGGGASKTSSECQSSMAADFSIRNSSGTYDSSIGTAIKAAASACGGRVNDESSGGHPHIHVSAQTSCCSL
jgi:hypothetical protein